MPFQKGHKLAKGGARPNPGPIPAVVREACRLAVAKRVTVLEAIMDNPKARDVDRIAAFKVLAGVGLPAQHEHEVAEKAPGDLTDAEHVALYKKLNVPESNWKPAILARWRGGKVESN